MDEKTIGVTARELYRHAAAVLDEVERSGRHVVISRYGRAVAFIGPVPDDYVPTDFERLHVAPTFQGMAPLEAVENDAIELNDEERRLLAAIATASPDWWTPQTRMEGTEISTLFRLEERDLVVSRPGGGWKLTASSSKGAAR